MSTSAISSPKLRAAAPSAVIVPNVLLDDTAAAAPVPAAPVAAPVAPLRRRATGSRRRATSVDSGSVAGPRTAQIPSVQAAT